MLLKNTFSRLHLLLLLLLTSFYGVNNYIWLKLNQYPFVDDEAGHFISSLGYAKIISQPSWDMLPKLLAIDKLYPPFFTFFAAIFSLPFGGNSTVMIMSNIVFLFGIFICLYLIGLKMGDARIGLLASLMLSLYPMFFHLGRMFMLEIAVCFMVVVGVTTMIYSDGFKKTKISILCGVIFGLGLLTKQSYVLSIAGPLAFIFCNSFFRGNFPEKKKVILNLSLAFIIGAAIASLWYVPSFRHMLPLAMASLTDSSLVPYEIPVFSIYSFFFYLRALASEQILFFFFILFVLALFIVVKRKMSLLLFLLIAWIILTYFIRTLVNNKFLYYTLSYLPAIALISACGILSINRSFFRRAVICLVFIVGFLQFFLISYVPYRHISIHLAFHTGGEKDSGRMLDIFLFPGTDILAGVKYYYQRGDWQHKALVSRILKESEGIIPKIGIFNFDPNEESKKHLNRSTRLFRRDNYAGADFDGLNCYLFSNKISYEVFPLDGDLKRTLNFIISPVKLTDIDSAKLKKINIQEFSLVEVFFMPDNSVVYLYKHNRMIPFRLNYKPSISAGYRLSSGRIDISSENMQFSLGQVKSNGVVQRGDWLPNKDDWLKNWITQKELNTNNWQLLWIEFVPSGSGNVFIQLRGSLYPDNITNHHEVYVDDATMTGSDITLKNCSFESQNHLGNPVDWGVPNALSSQITELPRSGKNSLLVWHDSPAIQAIYVKAGVKYRVSAWFKSYNPISG